MFVMKLAPRMVTALPTYPMAGTEPTARGALNTVSEPIEVEKLILAELIT